MDDLISRQAAISAICNACGKIDCDKMNKCEKLQLPPANCSEFPNGSDDTISRQAAIDVADAVWSVTGDKNVAKVWDQIKDLPSAQPKQTDCEYCHEDSDGYVRPLEKNCHAFVRYGINGWEISLKAKGWRGSAKIMYCPMCGRELKHG